MAGLDDEKPAMTLRKSIQVGTPFLTSLLGHNRDATAGSYRALALGPWGLEIGPAALLPQ